MNKHSLQHGFFLFLACGWLLTSIGYINEVHARKASEARYEYDFNGVLEFGKVPPRAAWPGCGYCDSLIFVDPKTMDTLGYFTWRDSLWHTTYKPGRKDSVLRVDSASIAKADSMATINTSQMVITSGSYAVCDAQDWMDANPHRVDWDNGNGKTKKKWAYDAQFNCQHITVSGETRQKARERLDQERRRLRGVGLDVVILPH